MIKVLINQVDVCIGRLAFFGDNVIVKEVKEVHDELDPKALPYETGFSREQVIEQVYSFDILFVKVLV